MWTGFWLGILTRDYLFFPLPNAKAQTANFLTISLGEEENEFTMKQLLEVQKGHWSLVDFTRAGGQPWALLEPSGTP